MEDNPMKYYAGLDVSNAETSICIVDENNNIVKEAKVSSDPLSIYRYLQKTGLQFEKIGLEAGSLSHWLVTGLRSENLNVICIDSRFMAAILAVNINKTDRNDARSIANAMRCSNYKEVHIKSIESIKTNCLLTARKALVHQKTQLSNTVRGVLKTFGIKLPKGMKSIREAIKKAVSFDEAGIILISRTKAPSKLKSWGLKKKRKLKTQKAGMAVGRKIAINLHRMWIEDRDFDPQLDAEEFFPEGVNVETKKSKKMA
jgi:hypothetical protein